MTLIAIILMVFALLSNLKGYKYVFKGVRHMEDDFEKRISVTIKKAKESGLGDGKNFIIGTTFILLVFFNSVSLMTLIITNVVTDNNLFLLILGVSVFIMGLKNSKSTVKAIATERARFGITHILVRPLMTLYIITFFILLFS